MGEFKLQSKYLLEGLNIDGLQSLSLFLFLSLHPMGLAYIRAHINYIHGK